MKKKTIILGIESSCDETAASIIQENNNDKPSILSNIVSSQIDVHKKFGGVVPELAARSHIEKIDLITKKAINESKMKFPFLQDCGNSLEIFEGKEIRRRFWVSPRSSII